jgi:hypothetical protein
MIKVKKAEPFPANENPFLHDSYNMGTTIGTNVTVMFDNHASERCNYLIVVNTETGERVRIVFDEKGTDRSIADVLVNYGRTANKE